MPAPVAVVTGAGRGLGAGIARLLADRGYAVTATDLVDPTMTAEAVGGSSAVLDVRDAEAVESFAAGLDRLDVWVNNAGVLVTGPAWEQTPEQRRLMIEVNALGLVNGTVAAIRAMRGRGGGHVVNVVSLAGMVAVPGEAVYSASKHAALGFSLSTAADLRIAGVRDIAVSCVCPDGMWTPMLHDKLDDPAAAMSFAGRLLEPDEVVRAVGKVLDRPRPVAMVPFTRGVQARVADALPGAALRALPLAVRIGRIKQKRLRRKRS